MLKAVNSDAKPSKGIAQNVTITGGEWSGKTDFNVIDVDGYPLVLV